MMANAAHVLQPVSLALLIFSLPGVAQHPPAATPSFHPGEWQIDSTQTVMGSRQITSQTRICAKEQLDFWKVAQQGMNCKTPKTHAVSGGVRVQVHCTYSQDKLHSEIHSDVIETITDHGNRFTLDGTSTTDTVYEGVQPKQTSTHLQAIAYRVGDCP